MKLIGMLDSPFVRRVAITLRWLGVEFDHQALSVFVDFERFHQINPLVKAPTLVCDDGTVLMDSSIILQYVELNTNAKASLHLQSSERLGASMQLIGAAQATAEKLVQFYYEKNVRPPEARFADWEARIVKQIQDGYRFMESLLQGDFKAEDGFELNQATIAVVATVNFHEEKQLNILDISQFPALQKLWKVCESTDLFKAFPPVGPESLSLKA